MTLLITVLSLSMILTIWFKSDAFVEYLQLFRLTKLGFIKDYLKIKTDDPSLQYLDFLQTYHDCFFVRLITCPICTSVWLSILIIPILGWQLTLATSFLSLSLYLGLSKLLGNG
jgi:hypothetical protein